MEPVKKSARRGSVDPSKSNGTLFQWIGSGGKGFQVKTGLGSHGEAPTNKGELKPVKVITDAMPLITPPGPAVYACSKCSKVCQTATGRVSHEKTHDASALLTFRPKPLDFFESDPEKLKADEDKKAVMSTLSSIVDQVAASAEAEAVATSAAAEEGANVGDKRRKDGGLDGRTANTIGGKKYARRMISALRRGLSMRTTLKSKSREGTPRA